MGQLNYDLTDDDYLAFNQHAAVSAPALADQARRVRIIGVVVVPLLVGIVMWAVERNPPFALLLAGIAAAVTWFSWPRVHRWAVTSQLRRVAATSGLGRTGATRLGWDEATITEAATSSRATVGWDRLERVEETPDHLFLFVGPLEGLIVPKRAGDGVAELARYARERLAAR